MSGDACLPKREYMSRNCHHNGQKVRMTRLLYLRSVDTDKQNNSMHCNVYWAACSLFCCRSARELHGAGLILKWYGVQSIQGLNMEGYDRHGAAETELGD